MSADPRGGTRRPALTYATGASRNQFGPIFIPAHVVRKYSASKIIAAVHFRIRNSFASLSRSNRSNSQSLRSAAPTAFATISVAHSKLAKASGRVGV